MNQVVLMIVHQGTSTPGLVGQVLKSWGYDLEIRCPALGHRLPEKVDAYEGIVIFGGPMSANDDHTLPFIRDELHWISRVLMAERPFLGICLGAQLLARVLGARVAPHPDEMLEIGYYPIQSTSLGGAQFASLQQVYHWHREGFDLPVDAVLLATGKVFQHQAFRYGQQAYGLQFHPEITAEMIAAWTEKAPEQLELPGAQARNIHFEKHARYSRQVSGWLQQFLADWLDNGSALPQQIAS